MKKGSKIILILGLGLICLALILSAFNIKKIINPFFDRGNDYNEETIEFNINDVDKLDIDTSDEKIIILPTNQDSIKITYYENEDQTYNIINENKTIIMKKSQKLRFFHFNINFFIPSIKIEIPKEKLLDYDIQTSNSKIEVKDLNINNAILKTSNGSVELDNLNFNNNINITTSNAKIELDNIIGRQLMIKTSNGTIELENIKAEIIDAKTSNAKIDTDNIKTDKILLKTSNGSIFFEKLDCPNIELKTSNAKIKGELIKDINNYSKDIETSNADIDIKGTEYGKKILDKNNNNLILVIKSSNGKIIIE